MYMQSFQRPSIEEYFSTQTGASNSDVGSFFKDFQKLEGPLLIMLAQPHALHPSAQLTPAGNSLLSACKGPSMLPDDDSGSSKPKL